MGIEKHGCKSCPEWLKIAYRKSVKFRCQGCDKPEAIVGKLQIHRKIPGYKGGLYIPENIQVLCKICHKLRSENCW